MSEMDQESKRIENWLTRGRPRAIRTRGTVRARGAPASGVTIKQIEEGTELLEQLKKDFPEVPWVVVVDGSPDAFAADVCLQVKKVRETSKFWLVNAEQEGPEGSALAVLTPLRLNPQDADDLRFLENLVADLVIVSTEPKASQGVRVRRWLFQARYILAKELDESLIEELRMPEVVDKSKAEIYVIRGNI